MLTLLEYATQAKDNLTNAVVSIFANTTPLLQAMPFQPVAGLSEQFFREGNTGQVAFRAINEAYDESSGNLVPFTVNLKFGGGDMDIDTALLRSATGNEQKAILLELKTKYFANFFTYKVFKGNETVNIREFNGIDKILANEQAGVELSVSSTNDLAFGLGLAAAGYTVDPTDATERNTLYAALDEISDGMDELYMAKGVKARITACLRNQGTSLQMVKDQFDKMVESWNGVPIRTFQDTPGGIVSGNQILAFNEKSPDGTVSTCASIYGIKWGVLTGFGGIRQSDIIVKDMGELQTKPAIRYRMEFNASTCLYYPKSVRRMGGLI